MSEGESSRELFTSESEIADHTQQESSTSSQQISLQQEDQESSPADQGGAIPDQKDQNVQVQSAIPLETPDEEQSDIVLVERAYLYLTKGTYPEGVTKNEKRSIRRKAERLKEENGELYYKKRGGEEVSKLI